ncbi:MAG: putative S-layer protein [Nanoarchaeota archaeon]|nr:putative S-layer protein [Nanoarchaeota archaeon]
MRNKLFTLLSLSILTFVVLMSCVSAASFTETFDNSSATGSYTDNSFLGDNGVTWSFIEAQDEDVYGISGNGLMLRDLTTGSKITSNTILGGLSSFSVQLKKGFTGVGDRQVELFINGVSKGNSTAFDDASIHTFTLNDLNIEGNVVIEIRNIQDGNAQIVIDNIIWTDYTAPIIQDKPEEVDECILTGSTGNLKLSIEDFSVEKGYGDDNEWFPLDEVQVEVEVENKGDEKIRNVAIGWGLYNVDTEEWVIDDTESDFNLGDDTKETVYINFKLEDVSDFEDGSDYVFYVWAEGEDNNLDSKPDTCVWASDDISIEIESDFVVLDNFEYSETISCGSTIQIMADVWNIGDSDQDEVSVEVYNKKLGLIKTLEIGDINAFDNEVMNLEFQIPQDAEEGWYALEFTVYDEDNDLYENDYDKDESIFVLLVKIEGGCVVIPKVSISASLISGGMSGEQMVVKATVSNTGTSIKEFSLSATGYTGWASNVALDAETFNLGAGQSKEVLFTFDVNRDASGTQLFDIEVVSEGQLELKQPVQVSITKKAGFLTGNMISEGNWYVWGIGALNVLLILIIIIVAIKVAKK